MSPAKKGAPLIAYLRRSQGELESGSIEQQRADIEKWAERNPKFQVRFGDEFVEVKSGSKHWKERELGAAMKLVETGEAAGIIVAYQSRLSRESGKYTAEVWEALEKAEARLVCVHENLNVSPHDDNYGEGEFSFGLNGIMARKEWRRHANNWRVHGKHIPFTMGVHTAPTPAGFERPEPISKRAQPLVHSEHAPAILAAFELRAKGGSWSDVARLLTQLGVPVRKRRVAPRNGQPATAWTTTGAAGLLRNRAYLGEITCMCGCGETMKGAHPEIVREPLFNRVQAKQTQKRGPAGPRQRSLLTGVIHCAGCGYRMGQDAAIRDGKSNPFYRCGQHDCPARANIVNARVEPYVEALALEHLGAVTLGPDQQDSPTDSAEFEQALEDAEHSLAEVIEQRGKMSPAAFGFAYTDAEAAVIAARDALDSVRPGNLEDWQVTWMEKQDWSGGSDAVTLSPAEVRERYAGMSLADKRLVIAAVIERVTVRRGAGPVSERVQVELKQLPADRGSAAA
jgi:hypothetical protein